VLAGPPPALAERGIFDGIMRRAHRLHAVCTAVSCCEILLTVEAAQAGLVPPVP
jgi:hypothetical protein